MWRLFFPLNFHTTDLVGAKLIHFAGLGALDSLVTRWKTAV